MWTHILVTFQLVLLKRETSYFDHTVVVNQPSLKENNFLCYGNLPGFCSWPDLEFHQMSVVCSVFISNQLHVSDGFSLIALEQSLSGNVRRTDVLSKEGVWVGFTLCTVSYSEVGSFTLGSRGWLNKAD